MREQLAKQNATRNVKLGPDHSAQCGGILESYHTEEIRIDVQAEGVTDKKQIRSSRSGETTASTIAPLSYSNRLLFSSRSRSRVSGELQMFNKYSSCEGSNEDQPLTERGLLLQTTSRQTQNLQQAMEQDKFELVKSKQFKDEDRQRKMQQMIQETKRLQDRIDSFSTAISPYVRKRQQ